MVLTCDWGENSSRLSRHSVVVGGVCSHCLGSPWFVCVIAIRTLAFPPRGLARMGECDPFFDTPARTSMVTSSAGSSRTHFAFPPSINIDVHSVSERPLKYGGQSDIYAGVWETGRGSAKVRVAACAHRHPLIPGRLQ